MTRGHTRAEVTPVTHTARECSSRPTDTAVISSSSVVISSRTRHQGPANQQQPNCQPPQPRPDGALITHPHSMRNPTCPRASVCSRLSGIFFPAIPPISTERAVRRARGSLLSGSNSLKSSSSTESAYRGRATNTSYHGRGEREREREREREISPHS